MNNNIINPLCKILDSKDTTVGGGSASALSGAMAASMIGMVARLSFKKPINFTVEQYENIAIECDELCEKLQQGCIEDMNAYSVLVDAFKLPKETKEEQEFRSMAIQSAVQKAAEVPRDNAYMNARVLVLGESLKNNSNPACMSDLASGLYLAESGLKGCILNIDANLGMIKDEKIKESLKDDMLGLLTKVICY